MNEQELSTALSSINLWWSGLPVPSRIKKSDNRRKIFWEIANKRLEDKNICSITGPRQVGKTTLMGQLIEFQVREKKIDPKRIIYIPLDNDLLLINSDNALIDCLKIYFDYVLGEVPAKLKSKVYVYLDEIQSLPDWAKTLKSYWDTYENVKFIVSGSSHTKLYSDASESLVGRINFMLVLPFKFREFLEYNVASEARSKELEFSHVTLRDSLKQSLKDGNPQNFYKAITQLHIKVAVELPIIKKQLDSYLIKGGYPGLLEFGENYDKALERIRTDLELTVYKDIHKIFNTRNSEDLMALLLLVANSSGQKINYTKLSQTIGIDKRTVTDYLSYTNLLFLTQESPFYKTNKFKQAEKNGKIYLLDVGHRNALLGKMNKEMLKEDEAGLVMQTVVFGHASRLRFYLSNYTEHEIFYWEDNTGEVDIVLDLPIIVLPIEVKRKSGEKGMAALQRFIEENKKSKWGIIITQDTLKIEKNILFLPLWAFLLTC